MIAFADLWQHAIFAEVIAGLADRPDDIGANLVLFQMMTSLPRQRHDLMVAVVQGRAGEIVHCRVDDHEILHAGLLHVLDARDQDTRIAGDEAAGLDQYSQAKWLEQRHQLGCVLGRSEQVFALG